MTLVRFHLRLIRWICTNSSVHVHTETQTELYEVLNQTFFFLFEQTDENFPSNHKCNRMIMIITDSAPGSYEHLFKEFNPQVSG